MGGMGGYGGSMGGSMGGYGGGMGGYGGGMGGYGGGGDMSRMQAQSLRYLLMESIEQDSWFETSDAGLGTATPFPDQQPKKMIIYQTPEAHMQIENLLNAMRKTLGNEVSIEARFLVVSENFLEDIGLDVDLTGNLGGKWGLVTMEQGSSFSAMPDAATKVPGSLGGMSSAGTISGGYGSILDDLQVSFLLRMTQGRSDTKTLTAPKATVISGESASFSVTDSTWYVLPASVVRTLIPSWPTGQTNQLQLPQPQQITTGTSLIITPTIMKDKKNVLLNITTMLNELLRMRTFTQAVVVNDTVQEIPLALPETEISQIVTRVSVPDGGTLLLGGQKLTAAVEKEVGIPILSKIPILGRAFTNRSVIRDQRVLLILVRPIIILPEEKEKEAVAAMESRLQ
jgi:general secretion pathway protein D